MAKTLDEHVADIRRERAARAEAEIREEAANRMAADAERKRFAAVAAEVGLSADANPVEVTRLHRLKQDEFWSDFIGRNPANFDDRFRQLAASVGVDLDAPNPLRPELRGVHDPRTAVWDAMRLAGHPATKRPIRAQDAVVVVAA